MWQLEKGPSRMRISNEHGSLNFRGNDLVFFKKKRRFVRVGQVKGVFLLDVSKK